MTDLEFGAILRHAPKTTNQTMQKQQAKPFIIEMFSAQTQQWSTRSNTPHFATIDEGEKFGRKTIVNGSEWRVVIAPPRKAPPEYGSKEWCEHPPIPFLSEGLSASFEAFGYKVKSICGAFVMLDDGAVLQMDRPQQAIDLMFRGAKHINVSRVPDWGADGASPEWLIGNMINIG